MKDKFYKLMEKAGYRTWTGRWAWEEILVDLAVFAVIAAAIGVTAWII